MVEVSDGNVTAGAGGFYILENPIIDIAGGYDLSIKTPFMTFYKKQNRITLGSESGDGISDSLI